MERVEIELLFIRIKSFFIFILYKKIVELLLRWLVTLISFITLCQILLIFSLTGKTEYIVMTAAKTFKYPKNFIQLVFFFITSQFKSSKSFKTTILSSFLISSIFLKYSVDFFKYCNILFLSILFS